MVKLRIFSLTTSQSPKLISKAVLTKNKKIKLDLPLYFQICAEGLRVFFFQAQELIFSPNALYLPTKQSWGRQTSDFDFARLSEQASIMSVKKDTLYCE